jgi:hypothetical protein
MEMSGRPMEGYILVDPPPRDERTLQEWLDLAAAFVNTLPPKPPRSNRRPPPGAHTRQFFVLRVTQSASRAALPIACRLPKLDSLAHAVLDPLGVFAGVPL